MAFEFGSNSYSSPKWWKESVIYQIYPSSFQSTPDAAIPGWGTIKGITSRLDYLQSLGVDVLWISPIFQSPQADMGYDISDYKAIDRRYGTLDDVDELIAQLKARNMRLMMDLVVNHTSDHHAWFRESRASTASPKRDWYHWQPPRGFDPDTGRPLPPNNWARILGEYSSAWTWDEGSGEFFLSLFTAEQPDLNWETPAVREAVWDIMRFWLDRGVCGYRLDVINMISKVPGYPDAEAVLETGHEYHPAWKYFVNGPRLHEFLREMHDQVLAKYDTITVGEMPGISDDSEILRTVGANSQELNMIFIFDVVDIDRHAVRMTLRPWTVSEMKAITSRWQRTMIEKDGWNSVFIENHDNPRSISRYADDSDAWRENSARLLSLMQTTLGGTLFVYQGEEIGMRNLPPVEWPIDEFKDCETINYWQKTMALYKDQPERVAEARKIIDTKARDHARTPMQWDASANAGFCPASTTPWMTVNNDYKQINAAAQQNADSESTLSPWQWWQRGLADRKEHKDVFVYGDFEDVSADHEKVYAYVRTSSTDTKEKWVVVLNFSGEEQSWSLPDGVEVKSWVASTYTKAKAEGREVRGAVTLKPWEGLLGRCQ
ncbi:glycoside hydrolase superfamily [Coniella lustricola]|uniref:Glycoside hydrolase superfamily n=1 Tax=Coniella lustricola TaxID=2025994 RepID=A0A2T3AJ67_9PEZI|nr:glycoside hydrolase superfamily [Coniella lustricola]